METPSNPNDFTETFQYDALGRQTLHVSFEGAVTQSLYDPETGRLSEKRFFDNRVLSASMHDRFGRAC